MNAKHSIGAIVTACTYEKKPNPMPATLPNAKCGNLAVPPETGYIAPSSAWERARTMTMIAATIQASQAPPPISSTAVSGANSQPEPMIDVSDAQVAPTRPSSRFRPTSVGTTSVATDSLAMFEPSSGFAYGGTPQRLGLMVMIVKEHEKEARGFISVTRVAARAHVSALPGLLPGRARPRRAPGDRLPARAFPGCPRASVARAAK